VFTDYFHKAKAPTNIEKRMQRLQLRRRAAEKHEALQAFQRKKYGKVLDAPKMIIGVNFLSKTVRHVTSPNSYSYSSCSSLYMCICV